MIWLRRDLICAQAQFIPEGQFTRRRRNSCPKGNSRAAGAIHTRRAIHAPQAQFMPEGQFTRRRRNSCPKGNSRAAGAIYARRAIHAPQAQFMPEGQFTRRRRNSCPKGNSLLLSYASLSAPVIIAAIAEAGENGRAFTYSSAGDTSSCRYSALTVISRSTRK